MESVLEAQRRLHEEKERLVDTMTREWLHDKKNVSSPSIRNQINNTHFAAQREDQLRTPSQDAARCKFELELGISHCATNIC
jgi:hypothetical protein